MAFVEGENPLSKTSGKPRSIEGSCPSGYSYSTKPIFQNFKKTHLYMRFLSNWVLLRDKTHFSKSQENLHKTSTPSCGPFWGKPTGTETSTDGNDYLFMEHKNILK